LVIHAVVALLPNDHACCARSHKQPRPPHLLHAPCPSRCRTIAQRDCSTSSARSISFQVASRSLVNLLSLSSLHMRNVFTNVL
jgi:hypothetical protein